MALQILPSDLRKKKKKSQNFPFPRFFCIARQGDLPTPYPQNTHAGTGPHWESVMSLKTNLVAKHSQIHSSFLVSLPHYPWKLTIKGEGKLILLSCSLTFYYYHILNFVVQSPKGAAVMAN